MKSLSLALITMLALSLQAYAAEAVDFDAIIKQNSQAQNDLHKQIKETVESSRIAAQEPETGSQVIADNAQTVHVKTKKDMLTFAKEKKQSAASQQQNDKRLAQEFQNLE
ncbi:hypothetical protein CIK05_08390 [Bdellovibrio sp. qaytius]|nr:hypothetical protein CIK05_08390 [Bdellovibrio sp. qaytius]